MVHIGNDWDIILKDAFTAPFYQALRRFLAEEYRTQTVYPDMHDLFNALKCTAYRDVRVVILGQDPYHGPGQAHGMSFSVQKGVPLPPSLQNIFKELGHELGVPFPKNGNLTPWAKQGVLMLNTCLSVRAGQPNSHRGHGWETLTDSVIQALARREKPMVFLLWGANARAKMPLLAGTAHLVLNSAHPSPLSAYNGFFGNGHFQKTNDFLLSQLESPIDWALPD